MLALKQYRPQKRGFSDLLNPAAVVEDGIVLNKDGSLMAAWSYDGPDTESATALERDHLSAQLNAILARLGTGYMLHVDAIRTPAVSYPSPDRSFFPDPITRLIDDERRQHFQSAGTFFESRHVLVLTYNPPDLRASKVASMMYTETGGRRETYADTVLRTFRRTCEEIERALDNVFRVQRLGAEEVTDDQGRTVVFDRFLQHLNFCITGDDHPIALPPIPMYLDAILGTEFVSAITPMVGDAYVLVVAIEGFPSTSYSGILNVLDQLAILYRWSTRFIFLDHIDAEKHLAKERRKWAQKTRSFMNQVFNPHGRRGQPGLGADGAESKPRWRKRPPISSPTATTHPTSSSMGAIFSKSSTTHKRSARSCSGSGSQPGSRRSTPRKPTSARCPGTAFRTSAGR